MDRPSPVSWLIRAVAIGSRYGIGFIFFLSALSKLGNPDRFKDAVESYDLLSSDFNTVIALGLPWIELVLSLCLLSGIFIGGSFLLSITLLVAFAGAQASVLSRGMSIGCGCFDLSNPSGSDSDLVGTRSMVRTAVLGLLAIVGYVTYIRIRLTRVSVICRSKGDGD